MRNLTPRVRWCLGGILYTSPFVLAVLLFVHRDVPDSSRLRPIVTFELAPSNITLGETPKLRLSITAPAGHSLYIAKEETITERPELLIMLLEGGHVSPAHPPRRDEPSHPLSAEDYQFLPAGETFVMERFVWGIPREPGDYWVRIVATLGPRDSLHYETSLQLKCHSVIPELLDGAVKCESQKCLHEVLKLKSSNGWRLFLRNTSKDQGYLQCYHELASCAADTKLLHLEQRFNENDAPFLHLDFEEQQVPQSLEFWLRGSIKE